MFRDLYGQLMRELEIFNALLVLFAIEGSCNQSGWPVEEARNKLEVSLLEFDG